jgi:hypothetical protein
MAIAHVQSKGVDSGAGSGTTQAITFSAAVGSGNLVCGIISCAGGFVLNSVTDDKSNSYTILDHVSDPTGQENWSFYLGNITNGPTTVTANFNGTVGFRAMTVDEFSGIAALANPLDGHASNDQVFTQNQTTDAITSTAFTPTQSGDLIYGGTVNSNNNDQATAGTGFTFAGNDTAGAGTVPVITEFLVQGTAASIAATFTDTTASDSWSTFVMAFKAAVVAAAPLVAPLLSPPRGIGPGPSVPFAHTISTAALSQASTLALLAATLGAGFGRAAATGKAALAARSAAEGEGGAALTGRAALAATSAGQGKATLNFTGRLTLAARSLGAAIGRLSPPGTSAIVSLFARALGMGAGRAGMTGAAAMKAASIGEGQGRNTPTFKAQLAAASRAAGIGKLGNMTGKVGLAARSLAAATGRALPPGAHAVLQLIANGFAMAAGRLRLIGTVPLAGASRSSAQGRGAIAGKVSLAARTMAASSGRLLPSGIQQYAQLAASGFAAAMGRVWVFMRSPRAAIVLFENRSAQPLDDRVTAVPMENRTAVVPPRGVAEIADEDRTAVVPPKT